MLVTRRGQRVAHYFATKQKRVQTSSQGWKPTYHKAKGQTGKKTGRQTYTYSRERNYVKERKNGFRSHSLTELVNGETLFLKVFAKGASSLNNGL